MKQVTGDDDSSVAGEEEHLVSPLQCCDIRHLSKDSAASLHRVRTRNRFKRSASQVKTQQVIDSLPAEFLMEPEAKFTITGWDCGDNHKDIGEELKRACSHDSFSVETVEPTLAYRDEPKARGVKLEPRPSEIELELTLSLNPVMHGLPSKMIEISDSDE
jgi:hypothetical protein